MEVAASSVKERSGGFDTACRKKSFRMKDFTYLGMKICISLRVMGTGSDLPEEAGGKRRSEQVFTLEMGG